MRLWRDSLETALAASPQGPKIVRRVLQRVAERKAMDTLAFTTYQLSTARTDRADVPPRDRIANHAMGLAGETGELVDAIKKRLFHGHDLDRTKVREEIGDVLWYLARLAADFDLDLGACAEANVEKLRRRYPEGFSEAASVARVDAQEGA